MEVGDITIYPGHGISVVMGSEEDARFTDEPVRFWVLKVLDGSMVVRVNQTGAAAKTIRPLGTPDDAKKVFELLEAPKNKIDVSTWNRRFRDYTNKVRSGSLLDMATVYRELSIIRVNKGFSFGEKKVFEQVELMVAQELCCILDLDEDVVLDKMRSQFTGLDFPKESKKKNDEED